MGSWCAYAKGGVSYNYNDAKVSIGSVFAITIYEGSWAFYFMHT